MRKNLLLLCLIFLVSCNHEHKGGNSDTVLKVSLISQNDNAFKYEKHYQDSLNQKTYYIKLSIVNKTDKQVSFWMMSCSWARNFIINNDSIGFRGWACDSNVPVIEHLRSNDSLVLKAAIIRSNYTPYQNIQAKFGFIIIDTLNCKGWDDFDSIMRNRDKHNKIIWSNSLSLN